MIHLIEVSNGMSGYCHNLADNAIRPVFNVGTVQLIEWPEPVPCGMYYYQDGFHEDPEPEPWEMEGPVSATPEAGQE